MTTTETNWGTQRIPTGNFIRVHCGDGCKLLHGMIVTLKELVDENGNVYYGNIFPLRKCNYVGAHPRETMPEDFSAWGLHLDTILASIIHGDISNAASEGVDMDGFVPISIDKY